jgi:hypothetical protein
MDEQTPIWRQAINDREHPLHRAAWMLFSDKMNLKYADRVLSEQRDEVIEFMFIILDTDELYAEGALGSGYAPINAVELLGHWRVTKAIPYLLEIIGEDNFESIVCDKASFAMENMDESVLDEVIAFADKRDNKLKVSMGFIIAKLGSGKKRAFDWVVNLLEKQTDDWDIMGLVEQILTTHTEMAIPYLEECVKKRKFKKDICKSIEIHIKEVREGKWDDLINDN